MTAQRLANILGTSTRTIYRDINTLSLAHVPISMDYGPGGGYYLPEDYQFDSTIFTREEAVSLILSTDIAGNYSLFAGDDGLHRALIKLEATLPEEYRSDVRAARERILFDTSAWCSGPNKTTYLESIRSALLGTVQIEIRYPCISCVDGAGVKWRRVDPIGLVFKGVSLRHIRTGVWYLVAYCHTCKKYQTFRVGNIENLKVLELRADPHPDFDLQTYWKSERALIEGFQQPLTMRLEITPEARQRLEGRYTILTTQPNGSIVVQVQASSIESAVSYVLSFGTDATVLAPEEVRAAVSLTARAIAEKYHSAAKRNAS